MRRVLPILFAAITLAVVSGDGRAMPVSPAPHQTGPAVTLVSGGCGPYRHRGFFGYCRLNLVRPYVPRGFYRPFRFYRPFMFIRRPFFRFRRGW